jgi:hypothetical protein
MTASTNRKSGDTKKPRPPKSSARSNNTKSIANKVVVSSLLSWGVTAAGGASVRVVRDWRFSHPSVVVPRLDGEQNG